MDIKSIKARNNAWYEQKIKPYLKESSLTLLSPRLLKSEQSLIYIGVSEVLLKSNLYKCNILRKSLKKKNVSVGCKNNKKGLDNIIKISNTSGSISPTCYAQLLRQQSCTSKVQT
jgi:hypothetical protein